MASNNINRFNIRVYGICIHEDCLLVNEEHIMGRSVVKFAGGGLEFGEGMKACLEREWKEELNLDIQVLEHFYTTDFFVPSAFDKFSQVISVYYKVAMKQDVPLHNTEQNERSFWLPLHQLKEDTFTLPIDQHVGQLLLLEQGRKK